MQAFTRWFGFAVFLQYLRIFSVLGIQPLATRPLLPLSA